VNHIVAIKSIRVDRMIAGKSNGNASLSWKGKREKMHRKFEENLTRGLSQFFISLEFFLCCNPTSLEHPFMIQFLIST
jgi:hypothetical protein